MSEASVWTILKELEVGIPRHGRVLMWRPQIPLGIGRTFEASRHGTQGYLPPFKTYKMQYSQRIIFLFSNTMHQTEISQILKTYFIHNDILNNWDHNINPYGCDQKSDGDWTLQIQVVIWGNYCINTYIASSLRWPFPVGRFPILLQIL